MGSPKYTQPGSGSGPAGSVQQVVVGVGFEVFGVNCGVVGGARSQCFLGVGNQGLVQRTQFAPAQATQPAPCVTSEVPQGWGANWQSPWAFSNGLPPNGTSFP